MLRVAIVGCGKIADQHVLAIQRIAGSRVVAVCDREPLMAQQLAERFAIEGCFADVGEMLSVARPDVVHVTTPPQSHHDLAAQCLQAGSHVYLEKPFTVTASEAARLIALAQRCERLIMAGHNYQFDFPMLQLRRLIDDGLLGARDMLDHDAHQSSSTVRGNTDWKPSAWVALRPPDCPPELRMK